MSELLLKGATMTNAHCTDCGDPVFRYDGQEFCPTCQKPVAREESEAGEDNIEVADPSDDAHVQFGAEADDDAQTADDTQTADGAPRGDQPAGSEPTETPAADQSGAAAENAVDREIPSADPGRSPPSGSGRASAADEGREARVDGQQSSRNAAESRPTSDGVASELSAAESLLAETVHRFAQRAAESEDPRRAREHLSAAREAAEALDAVRF